MIINNILVWTICRYDTQFKMFFFKTCMQNAFRTLTMQDSITESKTINYILFMLFCWRDNIFIEEKDRKK